jgi:hypothetical protein
MRDDAKLAAVAGAMWALVASISIEPARAAVDFTREIKPLIESACLRCHNEHEAEGGLRLDSFAAATSEELGTAALVVGDPEASSFYQRLLLPPDDPQAMPPGGPPLAKSQLKAVREWIAAGASWPSDAKLETQPRIDFVEHVQPILEMHCLSCHGGEHVEGEVDLATSSSGMGHEGLIVPFAPEESSLFTSVAAAADDPQLMPPTDQGGPLAGDSIEILRLWIAQGAIWPEEVALKVRPKPAIQVPSPDDMQLVRRIHAKIVETARQEADAPRPRSR